MLILALDTTTRGGSLALMRNGRVLEVFAGDPGRTHATRLPGDILACLARHGSTLGDIDLYGVAVGPGSFTGLRIGIATIQGLAFASGRPVVGVSALDALVEAADAPGQTGESAGRLRAAWIDAQRGEVYGCLYRWTVNRWAPLTGPMVNQPAEMLADWADTLGGAPVEFVGDGATAYVAELERLLEARARLITPAPLLAAAIASLAERGAADGLAGAPHRIRPLYVRRPDAELARERGRTGAV
jgi:tRNA threonylcarbamoyladenosine biosynthesis protein TsaB